MPIVRSRCSRNSRAACMDIGEGGIGGNAGQTQQRLQPLQDRVALFGEMGNDGVRHRRGSLRLVRR